MSPEPFGFVRLTLATEDDRKPFLRRWGWRGRLFGVYLHHLADADPGEDLHDHPWGFVSLVLRGGYTDERAPIRVASKVAEQHGAKGVRGYLVHHRARRWHHVPRTMAHRISHVRPGTWTLVLRGPVRQQWGFYVPNGFETHELYHTLGHDGGRIRLEEPTR